MDGANSTCWTVIRAAARADAAPERAEFVRRYAAPIRAYLGARWRGRPRLREEVDDATQEVFVECFRQGGALAKADEERAGGFRAFLYGVARHVALRAEGARPRDAQFSTPGGLDDLPADEPTLSRAFDRAWAQALVRAAAHRMAEEAARGDAGARRRVELLRRRFSDGAPIRDVAREWGVDAARVHHEYARARDEFRAALFAVVALECGGTAGEVARQCAQLVQLLDGGGRAP
ncbi:MAG TPA: sigma-70 family RNA polymerase sigma factor [Planctomycetota bacterium]|nr:sigma-70 family RNA polymerase sigma factor [Planctomycetota bacterium]